MSLKIPFIQHKHLGKHLYGLRVTAQSPNDAYRYKVLEFDGEFVRLRRFPGCEERWYNKRNGAMKSALQSSGMVIYQYWFLSRDDCREYLVQKRASA